MSTQKFTKRERLLSSARSIVLQQGVAQLTLDGVANDAGVSKGGLLYHFPSKDALIAVLIQDVISDFEQRVDNAYALLPDIRGRWLKAFVEISFEDDATSLQTFLAIAAAIANRPDLIQPLQTALNEWTQKATQDGVPLEVAQLVITATNGVLLERMFWADAFHDRLKQSILDLIDSSVGKQR